MLIVEDGSGLGDANAYLAVAEADSYHALRGNAAWAAAEDAAKEAAIVRATDTLDWSYGWRGAPAGGALSWPRTGAADDTGRALVGVPEAVRRACAELALRALSGELRPDLPRGGRITHESAGPISVSYAAEAPAETVRPAVEALLRPLLRCGNHMVRA
ncbi:MAG: hypothetical protein K2Q10_03955 [Rhodospirillales bacterium]|nr:hypothetical protein [Rhodospirillales bacterium]